MKWNEIEISELTDAALQDAAKSLALMEANLKEKRNSDEYKKKIGTRPIPELNPTFIALQIEIQKELEKRNITNG